MSSGNVKTEISCALKATDVMHKKWDSRG